MNISCEEPAIRLYRPMQIEYMTVGYILRYEESVYTMTEDRFVRCCMFYSHGSMNPQRAQAIHRQLMEEAGL